MNRNKEIWNNILTDSIASIIECYFLDEGWPEELIPNIVIRESYSGSWIIEASVEIFAGIGVIYALLKFLESVSKLSDIAKGLAALGKSLKKVFSRIASKKAKKQLDLERDISKIPSTTKIITVDDFVIDIYPCIIHLEHQIKEIKQQIAERAYYRYRDRDSSEGNASTDWLGAEKEFLDDLQKTGKVIEQKIRLHNYRNYVH